IVLISPRAVASRYVKNEIIYALDKGRPFLAIHMEKTGLDKGLELCMSGHQALCKFEMENERYQRKLNSVLRGYLSISQTIDIIKPEPIKNVPRRMDTRLFLRVMDKPPHAPSERGLTESTPVEEPVTEEPVTEDLSRKNLSRKNRPRKNLLWKNLLWKKYRRNLL
ncbi:MAG: TIR domain-containing protein, partial [Opitutales bacterium]